MGSWNVILRPNGSHSDFYGAGLWITGHNLTEDMTGVLRLSFDGQAFHCGKIAVNLFRPVFLNFLVLNNKWVATDLEENVVNGSWFKWRKQRLLKCEVAFTREGNPVFTEWRQPCLVGWCCVLRYTKSQVRRQCGQITMTKHSTAFFITQGQINIYFFKYFVLSNVWFGNSPVWTIIQWKYMILLILCPWGDCRSNIVTFIVLLVLFWFVVWPQYHVPHFSTI